MSCTVVQLPRLALFVAVIASTLALAAPARAADVGAAGPTFGAGASAPTGQKPQSKLWFNDGSWWGILYNDQPATPRYEIYRDVNGTWTPTDISVDTRRNVWVDALWDGTNLNLVSAGDATSTLGVRYSRFTYNAGTKTYTRDVGPVALTTYGVEAAVLDRDGTGRLWATWTHDSDPANALTVVDNQVEVAHSTAPDGSTWSAPVQLPGSPLITGDDISAIVRYAGHIGVMYSDQNLWNFTFVSRADMPCGPSLTGHVMSIVCERKTEVSTSRSVSSSWLRRIG